MSDISSDVPARFRISHPEVEGYGYVADPSAWEEQGWVLDPEDEPGQSARKSSRRGSSTESAPSSS